MNIGFVIQGLTIDVSVLEALLKQSRNNHGRTLYYRRLSMALKSMKRYELLEFGSQLETFQKDCRLCQQRVHKKNKKRLREERWGEEEQEDPEICELQNDFTSFEATLLEKFPEILSRIQHASIPLFTEVNRGFFLPFCTVALGALGRIRALIQQLGISGSSVLKEIQMDSGGSFVSLNKFEIAMKEHYMESPEEGDRKTRHHNGTASMLSNLGLHNAAFQYRNVDSGTEACSDGVSPSEREAKTPMQKSDEEEMEVDVGPSNAIPTEEIGTSLGDHDDDDIGESVRSSLSLDPPPSNSKRNDKIRTESVGGPVDQNLGLVQKFKKKKSSKSQSATSQDSSISKMKKEKKRKSETDDRKSKKKKKKKEKSGDYFDDLFR